MFNNSAPGRQHLRSYTYDFNNSKPYHQHLRSHPYDFNDVIPTPAETIVSF